MADDDLEIHMICEFPEEGPAMIIGAEVCLQVVQVPPVPIGPRSHEKVRAYVADFLMEEPSLRLRVTEVRDARRFLARHENMAREGAMRLREAFRFAVQKFAEDEALAGSEPAGNA